MKKERVPLTQDNREQLESWNRLWLPAARPLTYIYLAGIGLAFAIMMAVSYFSGWNDNLAFFLLVAIAACAYQLIKIWWLNFLRNLDLLINMKCQVEIPRHQIRENNGEFTVNLTTLRKPIDVSAEIAFKDLWVEYAPISKTLLLVTSLY